MKTIATSTFSFLLGAVLALLVTFVYVANVAPNMINNAMCEITTDSNVDYVGCKIQTALN